MSWHYLFLINPHWILAVIASFLCVLGIDQILFWSRNRGELQLGVLGLQQTTLLKEDHAMEKKARALDLKIKPMFEFGLAILRWISPGRSFISLGFSLIHKWADWLNVASSYHRAGEGKRPQNLWAGSSGLWASLFPCTRWWQCLHRISEPGVNSFLNPKVYTGGRMEILTQEIQLPGEDSIHSTSIFQIFLILIQIEKCIYNHYL